jgi:hypothetical protein
VLLLHTQKIFPILWQELQQFCANDGKYLSTEFPWCTSDGVVSDCLNWFSVLTDGVTGTSELEGADCVMEGDAAACDSSTNGPPPTINVIDSRSRSSSLEDSSRKYFVSAR